jgi:hypothetical protein
VKEAFVTSIAVGSVEMFSRGQNDVVVDPAQRGDLVEQSEIAVAQAGQIEKAERALAIIDSDDDDPAVAREFVPRIPGE